MTKCPWWPDDGQDKNPSDQGTYEADCFAERIEMTPDLKELEQSTETIVLNALNRAYQLGQTYWQQADSESYSQNAKSDVTAEKFRQLRDETRISVCGLEVENFALRSGTGHLGELIDELRAELEQARKDAERFNYLLGKHSYHYSMQPDSPAEHGIEYQWQQGSYEERDFGILESLDAAIAKEQS